MTYSGKKDRPLILVTNDDGLNAKGIKVLAGIAEELGDVVVISAPDSQSGMSHAITIKTPLRVRTVEQRNGLIRYEVNGTPVDGVKLAINQLLKRKPDLILSGINHGANSSSSVIYSGTMAAAIEGSINHIPAIGFSLLDYDPDADFSHCTVPVKEMISRVLEEGLPDFVCLNINIPKLNGSPIKGVKVCRQVNGYWLEEFEKRTDPHGGEYYWLTGSFFNREDGVEGTDEWALNNNYISVVPIHFDLTAYHMIDQMRSWEKKYQ